MRIPDSYCHWFCRRSIRRRGRLPQLGNFSTPSHGYPFTVTFSLQHVLPRAGTDKRKSDPLSTLASALAGESNKRSSEWKTFKGII
ncbi:hypothetical protein CDAR_243681 [Caerostris darwini]|uniref:Uncharacterized protein n=1 Tax=Caerostris darwini TaxID=1538125 RepID=A0AAV4VDD3_9ARAC|nr:hypothetical protein CDAR_243681 [Caerostris darwini]